jgi:16S rRNA (adenine1518-N6/adenine1519-N6)-dimethyltransferase
MSGRAAKAPGADDASSAGGPRHRPRKRFGQNFLHDPRVIARIVDAIDPQPGQTLVEIGPGQAALTRALIERAGHVTAIEIDRDLAARLRTDFPPQQLTLIEGDALAFDWSALPGRLRVVGNLPYNISSPLLFALVAISDRVIDQHFMLQKEVVERMVAPPGSRTYGRLSVMLQHRYAMTRLFDVPRGAFNPPPKVTSSIVRMVPIPAAARPAVDADRFGRVVAAAFGQRRKTLKNALSALLDAAAIASAGIDPQARAETLSNDDFVRLARLPATPEADHR